MIRSPFSSPDHRSAARAAGLLVVGLLAGVSACEGPLAPGLQLALSEAQVEFRAVRGSTAPLTRTIQVTNSGGGRLGPVSCPAAPADWLTCAVSGGTTVVLTADPSGLSASPAAANVALTAPGGSASATVRMVVEQPVLAVSIGTVAFTASEGAGQATPATASVTVSNSGAGTLANLGTITCAPSPATTRVTCGVNQAQGTLTVSVNPQGLPAGTHVFPLAVNAEFSGLPQTVSVTLVVAAAPRIGLSRTVVQFQAVRGGAAPAAQTVAVTNVGGGALGTVSCPANPAAWLTCTVSGATVTLAADPATLTSSPAAVSVPISAGGALNTPQVVEVSLALQQPLLTLDRNEVIFTARVDSTTATPAQDTVLVTNSGAGTLANLGAITCAVPTGAPVTCAVDGATGQLRLSANPTGLTRGERVYLLQVSAPNSDVTRILTVRLRVTAPSTLAFSPPALFLAAIRGSTTAVVDTVTVTNAGDGVLGTVACPASPAAWLSCAELGTDRLVVTADPSGLTTTPATVDIQVTADSASNSPAALPVTLTIQQPVLAVSTSRADFSSVAGSGVTTPASVAVTVTNTGAGTLANLGGLTCAPPGGAPVGCAVDQGTGELALTVTPGALTAGTYVWVVTVSAPNASNGSQTVTVVLTVT
jgi:hypothetical protein